MGGNYSSLKRPFSMKNLVLRPYDARKHAGILLLFLNHSKVPLEHEQFLRLAVTVLHSDGVVLADSQGQIYAIQLLEFHKDANVVELLDGFVIRGNQQQRVILQHFILNEIFRNAHMQKQGFYLCRLVHLTRCPTLNSILVQKYGFQNAEQAELTQAQDISLSQQEAYAVAQHLYWQLHTHLT